MPKFNIHIDPLWSLPLLIIGATQEKSWAEVGAEEIQVKFGIGEERFPLAEVASVEPHEWSLFYGIGHRVGYGGVGYVGSTDRVVEIKFKRPLSFNLIFGIHKDFPSFFLSLEDPDAFIAAVRDRLSPKS